MPKPRTFTLENAIEYWAAKFKKSNNPDQETKLALILVKEILERQSKADLEAKMEKRFLALQKVIRRKGLINLQDWQKIKREE